MCKFSLFCLPLILAASQALGIEYSVTSTADAGAGSLRTAITAANANAGLDTISFAIPGAGPHRITPLTSLPQIIDPVLIDGYSQPGSSEASASTPAVIQIEIDGTTLAAAAGNQFNLDFRMLSEAFTLQGVSLIGGDYGLYVHSGAADGSVVRGNYFGVDASGITPVPNSLDGVYSRGNRSP